MNEYTIDNPRLKRYYDKVWEMASDFESFGLDHIYFEDNSKADFLTCCGFKNTFVDWSSEPLEYIMDGYKYPTFVREYILKHKCMG
jgi:hypothetical protein